VLVKKGAFPRAEVVRVEGGMEGEEVERIVMSVLASNSRSKAVARSLENEEFFDPRELVDYALKSK
jgi:hypothetical protein